MRIDKIEFLEPYKCINKGVVIDFSDTGNYCALVGLNGSGKSSVLDCLNYSFVYGKRFLRRNNQLQSVDDIRFILNDKIEIANGYEKDDITKLPKYVIYNYSGKSKIADNIKSSYMYGNKNGIIRLALDYQIWPIAFFILYIINPNTVQHYNIDIKNEFGKWLKLTTTQYEKRAQYEQNLNKELYFLREMFKMEGFSHLSDNKLLSIFESANIKNLICYIIGKYINNDERIELKRIKDQFGYIDRLNKTESNIFNFKNLCNEALYNISEGQKKLLVLKLIMYLADTDTLVILDEPDANLDIQKKRELFENIESCKGQVILATHDPIMTKWMKGHLIFMKDGKQVSKDLEKIIYEMSGGEISYQETMLMLFRYEHFVFTEGKSDIEWIKKAIDKLGYSNKFSKVGFLSLGSSGAVKEKYETIINKLMPKSTKKVLFLFDADDGGLRGKEQIDEIINDYTKLNDKKQEYEKQLKGLEKKQKELSECQNELGKNNIKEVIKKIEGELASKRTEIDNIETTFNPSKLLTYYFYNHGDSFDSQNPKEWFNIEDYLRTDLYDDQCKIKKSDIINFFNKIKEQLQITDFLCEYNDNDIIRYYHLKVCANKIGELSSKTIDTIRQKCQDFQKQIEWKIGKIKKDFGEKIYKYNDSNDFELFRPLLDKILEKLELS